MVLRVNARTTWTQGPLPAVIVPAAVGVALAAELRARAPAFTRYTLVDRGSYDFIDEPPFPDVLDVLAGIATEVTGRALRVASARLLRLNPGDYLLVRHDRVHDDRPVELVLDVSAAPVADAEVHWRHRGQVYFTMPSSPCALALVERGPTVLANHTYLSKRGTNSVVRLNVLLREAPR